LKSNLRFIKIKIKVKMSNEKTKSFDHLKSKYDTEQIKKIPFHLLDEDRIFEISVYIDDLLLKAKKALKKQKISIDVVTELTNISEKTTKILNLWKKDFSWEIMQAASNENYWEEKYIA